MFKFQLFGVSCAVHLFVEECRHFVGDHCVRELVCASSRFERWGERERERDLQIDSEPLSARRFGTSRCVNTTCRSQRTREPDDFESTEMFPSY